MSNAEIAIIAGAAPVIAHGVDHLRAVPSCTNRRTSGPIVLEAEKPGGIIHKDFLQFRGRCPSTEQIELLAVVDWVERLGLPPLLGVADGHFL
jgi:hypothetical protein